MNVTTRPRMTLEEFLAWEEQQEGRFEFNGGEPEEVTGGTDRHSLIKVALYVHLYGLLDGGPWIVFDSDMKIEVAGRVRYPDAFVGPRHIDGSKIRRDPIVIFEVLSDSTAVNDRTIKSAEYGATPTVRRYVMLEQNDIAATVIERAGEDWISLPPLGRESVLDMPEIGASLRLATIYRDVFPRAAFP